MSPFRLSTRTMPARVLASASGARASPELGSGSGPGGSDQSGSTPHAVPVPWNVVRRRLGVIEIEHCGAEVAHSVRFALSGAGMLGLSLPTTVHPGSRIRVAVRGARADEAIAAHDAMLVLRWFQPDGTELLWPIAVD
ncbi:hypothetical protein ACF07D_05935 [Leucobacter sp. NPDC015123]|uniref:hypothetical protein n=1 Tax=Leucobacter sp. NPDC015123 TaxID=3364129 RepID=UPI0036F494FA